MKEKGQKIVVMGGSFNPPTVAHFKLMKAAIDAIDAGIGFFVPVSDANRYGKPYPYQREQKTGNLLGH